MSWFRLRQEKVCAMQYTGGSFIPLVAWIGDRATFSLTQTLGQSWGTGGCGMKPVTGRQIDRGLLVTNCKGSLVGIDKGDWVVFTGASCSVYDDANFKARFEPLEDGEDT